MFGLNIGRMGAVGVPGVLSDVAFAVNSLFSQGEQGSWYDPSDIITMFQDSAGTTPVTAVGQPVGLILDKSKGLLLGTELVTNGGPGFTATTGWSYTGSVAGGVSVVAGELVTTCATVLAAPSDRSIRFALTGLTIGTLYKLAYQIKKGTAPETRLVISTTIAGGDATRVAAANSTTPSVSGVSHFFATATTQYLELYASNASASQTAILVSASIKSVAGNHASQSTAINRPTYQIDGNGKSYLAFNGTNSALATSSINFTATDKMTVFAGATKNSGLSMFVESSGNAASNNGSFYITSNEVGTNFSLQARGTTASGITRVNALDAVPQTITATIDIAAPNKQIRANAGAFVLSGGTMGTGNFGNYPLFIGARSGTSLFFNGNLYSLIIRGAASSASQISQTETYVNSKTGAY